ncbi:MAG: glycolate oxidase subunit GlcE [Burkholderiaceae bacterium]
MGLDVHAEGELAALIDTVCAAAAARTPLAIRAGGSKDFYGDPARGVRIDPRAYRGVVEYEPSELVVVARCGTPLAELEALLTAHGQMLAFEPPHFGAATVGGCVAAGLSGPRRAAAGSLRDFMLGAQLIDGRGQLLRFGGTVMKNVAGYDLSRVIAGSLGTLGLITQVAIKVLPRPATELTLRLELDEDRALRRLNQWAAQPLPISASSWHAGALHLRLSGAAAAVQSAHARLGGEVLATGAAHWLALREQTADFFAGPAPLWRLSLPSTTPPLALDGPQLIEWGGSQRWLRSAASPDEVFAAAIGLGGHATLFRGGDRTQVFTPLSAPIAAIHRRLAAEFDPHGIFNPGRMRIA